MSFSNSALLEFRFIRDTLINKSTKFNPLQYQLAKFCIYAEFLDTKLSEKSNFEGSRLNHKFQARYVIMAIAFQALLLFISCNVSRISEAKKQTNG